VRAEDVQAIRIQEIEDESVGAGRIPRTLEIEVSGELVNRFMVSDPVKVTVECDFPVNISS
jgi:DNA replicative helicase MCM subunit Mcm2 (Cdc46/Mcm family)